MSILIEVNCLDKQCPIIVNLEKISQIIPMRDGSTTIYIEDTVIKVKESFSMFRQFVMQTVTPDDIAARLKNIPKVSFGDTVSRIAPEPRLTELEEDDFDDSPVEAVKRGPGRPRRDSGMMSTTAGLG